jgi:MFS family permease
VRANVIAMPFGCLLFGGACLSQPGCSVGEWNMPDMTYAMTDVQSAVLVKNQFALLAEKRFARFFWAQFLRAANDNVFKFAFTVLATYHAADWGDLEPKLAGPVIGGLFILPFVLFSATAGQFADKYDKATPTKAVMNMEMVFMLLISAGFVWHILALLFVGVFLMEYHPTLFGPIKFAYLPQHSADSELTGGTGMIEMGTFSAILLCAMMGGLLVKIDGNGVVYLTAISMLLAIVGRIAAAMVSAASGVKGCRGIKSKSGRCRLALSTCPCLRSTCSSLRADLRRAGRWRVSARLYISGRTSVSWRNCF